MFTLASAAASAAKATAASVTTSRDDAETSGVKEYTDRRVVETRERLHAGSCQIHWTGKYNLNVHNATKKPHSLVSVSVIVRQ